MTISLKATRSGSSGGVALDGPSIVYQGSSNAYKITNWSFSGKYSATVNGGASVTVSGDTFTVVVPNPATVNQLTLMVTKDGSSTPYSIAVGAQAVVTPTITSPSASQTGVSLTPTLASSSFSTVPVGAGTHLSSEWQISTSSTFDTVTWTSGVSVPNKTSVAVPTSTLGLSTQYYARVRYNSEIGVSPWSITVLFVTTNRYVVTPTITLTNGDTAIRQAPNAVTSAFNTYGGTDTHASSDWQVLRNGALVWQSLTNTVDKLSITVPISVLAVSSSYTLRVRHTGTVFGSSSWATVGFTTDSVFQPSHLVVSGTDGSSYSQMYVFKVDRDAATYVPNAVTGLPTTIAPRKIMSSTEGNFLVCATETSYDGDSAAIRNPGWCLWERDGNYFRQWTGLFKPPQYTSVDFAYSSISDVAMGPGPNSDAEYFAFSPEGYGGNNSSISVYRRASTSFTRLTFNGGTSSSTYEGGFDRSGLCFSPDGKYFTVMRASASREAQYRSAPAVAVLRVDGNSVNEVAIPGMPIEYAACPVAWSPDSTKLFVAYSNNSADYTLYVFELENGVFKNPRLIALPTLAQLGGYVTGISCNREGNMIGMCYNTSGGGGARVWAYNPDYTITPLTMPSVNASNARISFSKDDTIFAVSGLSITRMFRYTGTVITQVASPSPAVYNGPGGMTFMRPVSGTCY